MATAPIALAPVQVVGTGPDLHLLFLWHGDDCTIVYNPVQDYQEIEHAPATGVSFSKVEQERHQELKEYRELRRERAMVLEMASWYVPHDQEIFSREVKRRRVTLTEEEVQECWEKTRPLQFREYPIGSFERWSDRWFFKGAPVPSKQFLCAWFGCGALTTVKGSYCCSPWTRHGHEQLFKSGVRPPAKANTGWKDIPDSRQRVSARVQSILLERGVPYDRTLDRMLQAWVSDQSHHEQDPNLGWWKEIRRKRTPHAQDRHDNHHYNSAEKNERDGRDLYGVAAPIASKKPYTYSPDAVDGSHGDKVAVIPGPGSYYFSPDPFYRDQIFEFWHSRDLLSRTSLENIICVYTAEDYDKLTLEYELRRAPVFNAFTKSLGVKSKTLTQDSDGEWEYEDRRTAFEKCLNMELDDEDVPPRDAHVPNLAGIREWELWMKRTQGQRLWRGRAFWWKHYLGRGAEIKVLKKVGWVFKDEDESNVADALSYWQQRLRQDFISIFGEEVLARVAPKAPGAERVLDFEMHPSSLPWILPTAESGTYVRPTIFDGPNPQRETFGDEDEVTQARKEAAAALDKISVSSRVVDEVLIAIMKDEISCEQASKQTGVSEGTLRKRVHGLKEAVEKRKNEDELWVAAQAKSVVDPGIYALTEFYKQGPRLYKIADTGASDEDILRGFDELVVELVTNRHRRGQIDFKPCRCPERCAHDAQAYEAYGPHIAEIVDILTQRPWRVLPEPTDQTPATHAMQVLANAWDTP